MKAKDIENYRHTISELENNMHHLGNKLKEADSRVVSLTNELERIASILRDRQANLSELSSKNRQISAAFEEKKSQVQNLKEINDKLSINLSKVEETKGNFRTFMSEIERLNEVVSGKDNQIKNQRL